MQLVPHGPDVPDDLLRAHEEGRVVFFCGAGISCAAGLPTFKKMVRRIFRAFHTGMEPDEREAFSNKRYDVALGLLEKRLQDDHLGLRDVLPRLLRPQLVNDETLKTHDALLHLGRTPSGTLRLVTTNFDDLFETAAARSGIPCPFYSAPTLPLPLPRCWDGLVYLHGKLHENPTPFETANLILTDGDFGRAYLMEGWAARFTSMLLHNCEVCFIGYSIEDQVVRYMLDALDSDKRQGLSTRRVWAFRDNESPCDNWVRRGVTPIVYSVENEHLALHRTLHEWARLYKGDTSAKIEIVEQTANRSPVQSGPDDDFAGRLLWALSDRSGLPLKQFTSMEPPPSLEWFRRFKPLLPEADDKVARKRWNHAIDSLSPWLLRYANDERLIAWFAKEGGRVSPAFRDQMEKLLYGVSPATPFDKRTRILWRLLLTGRMARLEPDIASIGLCLDRIKRDGARPSLQMELRGLLAPYVRPAESTGEALRSPFGVNWEVALPVDDFPARFEARDFPVSLRAGLFDTLETILRDALGLCDELAQATGAGKEGLHSACGELAALVRDSWNALSKTDPRHALHAKDRWESISHPLFGEMAAASMK